MTSIQERKDALLSIMCDARVLLESLQEECPHPEYTADYKRTNDYFCVHLACPDCGVRSIIDAEDENGNRNPEYYNHSEARERFFKRHC